MNLVEVGGQPPRLAWWDKNLPVIVTKLWRFFFATLIVGLDRLYSPDSGDGFQHQVRSIFACGHAEMEW